VCVCVTYENKGKRSYVDVVNNASESKDDPNYAFANSSLQSNRRLLVCVNKRLTVRVFSTSWPSPQRPELPVPRMDRRR